MLLLTIEENISIVNEIKQRVPNIPIYLGGGANGDNISTLIKYYDGVSIATWIKDGNMRNPINPQKAKHFMDTINNNRKID